MRPLESQVKNSDDIDDDDIDDDDRAALHESLRESIEQMNEGHVIDAEVALAARRAHR